MKNMQLKTKALLAVAVMALAGVGFAGQAKADFDRGHAVNMIHQDEWRGRPPPHEVVVVQGHHRHEREWMEHERRAREWREHHHDEHVIYAPPPVVYPQPVISPGINFIIPLDLR